MSLSNEQAKVVYYEGKLGIVQACPGAGKSHVIVARTRVLAEDPDNRVLVCTFSRPSANELSHRIGSDLSNVQVSTIHSYAFRIVKDHWAYIAQQIGKGKWPEEPNILEANEEIQLIKEIVKVEPRSFYKSIQGLRSLLLDPHEVLRLTKQGVYFPLTVKGLHKWRDYEVERLSRGLLVFEDLTELALIAQENPAILSAVADKYNHIMIDEAQDTSASQWKLLRPLIRRADSTIIVGDLNQSIFAFRNADGAIFTQASGDEAATFFKLSQSYRLPNKIANFANKLLSSFIKPKTQGGTVYVQECASREEELDFVFTHLKEGSAILSRTNTYLIPFEIEAINRGLKYGGKSFFRSPHIQLELTGGQKPHLDETQATDLKQLRKQVVKLGLDKVQKLAEESIQLVGSDVFFHTGHSSKGLEFPDVYVVGCHQGHTPHRLATNAKEEKNIFYVMCTRAQQKLTLTYVGKKSSYIPEGL